MVDSIDVNIVFEDDLTVTDRVALFDDLFDLDGFECSTETDEMRERLTTGRDSFTNAIYRSVNPTVTLDPDVDGLEPLPTISVSFPMTAFKERVSSTEEVERQIEDVLAFAVEAYHRWRQDDFRIQYVIGASPTQTEQLRTGDDFLRTTPEGSPPARWRSCTGSRSFPPRWSMLSDSRHYRRLLRGAFGPSTTVPSCWLPAKIPSSLATTTSICSVTYH